jgi:uncharacterized membrane protein
MKKFTVFDAAALVVWLLPVVYLCLIYNALPGTVPLHYGVDGQVDRYGSKGEFLGTECVMLGAPLLVYLLLKFLPSIDPKRQVKYGESTFQKLAVGIVIFISALDLAIIHATVQRTFQFSRLLLPLEGLLFAFLGNMMNSVKPNYFVGFRTPWALESEDNWRATHRLVSKIWFAGGILITILTLILPGSPGLIVMLCLVGVMTVVPFIYSYLYFRKHRLKQQS